jgi:CheY-like chemotaxis protein
MRPDLVLMDVQMPVMDGIQATMEIRRQEVETGSAHLPIVALTAGAFDEDRRRCMDVGMDDFMPKPVNLGELERMLEKWLARHGAPSRDEA